MSSPLTVEDWGSLLAVNGGGGGGVAELDGWISLSGLLGKGAMLGFRLPETTMAFLGEGTTIAPLTGIAAGGTDTEADRRFDAARDRKAERQSLAMWPHSLQLRHRILFLQAGLS